MALNESASFLVALILSVLTFSGMQTLKPVLASSQLFTLLGGFMGSMFFVFLLVAVANLEKVLFGQGFQTQWLEVLACGVLGLFASASVHRVCATSAVLFGSAFLYAIHKRAEKTYGSNDKTAAPEPAAKAKKKKQ